MSSFRRQIARLVSRWASVGIQIPQTLLIDKAFLDLPELGDFLAGDRTLPSVPKQATELIRWEQILNQPNWTEEEFTHLLAVVFADYGAAKQSQRRTIIGLLRPLAYDGRTPQAWAARLQRCLLLFANFGDVEQENRRELTLAHLTFSEKYLTLYGEPSPYIPRPVV